MIWFNNLKIAKKLILAFGVVTLIAGIMGISAMTSIRNMSKAEDTMFHKMTIPIQYNGEAGIAFNRSRVLLRDTIFASTTESAKSYMDKMRIEDKIVKEKADKVGASMITSAGKKTYADFKNSSKEYGDLQDRICAFALQQKDKEALATLRSGLSVATAQNEALTKMFEQKAAVAKKLITIMLLMHSAL